MDVQAAEDVKIRMLTAWASARTKPRPAAIQFEASLDTAEEAPPPPPGVAVGYIRDRHGDFRVGVRAAATGVGLRKARKLVANLTREGIPVDFRTIPRPAIPTVSRPGASLDAANGQATHFARHCRPLYVGSSVSHLSGSAGTIGAFVRLADNTLGILSCSHVLALGGDANVGDPISQPARQDLPIALADYWIGKLSGKFAPLIAGKPNNLDAAIAILDDPATASFGNRIPDLDLSGANAIPAKLRGERIGAVQHVGDLTEGTKVAKIGRTSGYTEGVLTLAALTNFTPDIERKGVRATYPFPDVIEVSSLTARSPFARGGDSGALVFTLPDLRPIGIHFCSLPVEDEPSLNYLMPLDRICAMLAAEMI